MSASSVLVPLILAAAAAQSGSGVQLVTPQGRITVQAGVRSQPLPGRLPDAVWAHALRMRGELGLPTSSTLARPVAFGTRFGASFHMQQVVDGIEVEGAKVIVTVDRDRRVVQVTSSVASYERAVSDWRFSSDEALEIASMSIPLSMRTADGRPYGGTRQKMFPRGEEVRSGYLVWVPTVDVRDNWYVAVDASTGEVLWRRNRVFNADEADVYARSPGGLDAGVGVAPVQRVTLGHLETDREGGFLVGTQIQSLNCCPNENCSTAAGAKPKRVTGTLNLGGRNAPYDLVVCDRRPLATHDPLVNPAGSYVYAPVDPSVSPYTGENAHQLEPSDSDPFVEVNAFHHVNGVYDFLRDLSTAAGPLFPGENIPGFQMRDEKLGKKPAVWTNVTIPNLSEAQINLLFSGTARTDNLMRMDNAAFMPKENFDQLFVPELAMDVDALMIFQGTTADFGYDAPVLWHEFGHGAIYSTAKFESFTLDERSGNNEGGALHEGIADFIAGIYGGSSTIGEYVGPRVATIAGGSEGALRDMANTFACPDVLWGEVHQDSQHFSGALWEARAMLSEGIDNGETFDAAFYAALVSMTPATDFEQAAAVIANHVALAFTTVPDAKEKITTIFKNRGVAECSKVLDVTGSTEKRRWYGIGGTQQAGLSQGQLVPGPYQFKISVPEGASSVTVTGQWQSSNPFGGQPAVKLLAKSGSPITFTRAGASLTHDADVTANATGSLSARANIEVPCGGELYFTLASAGPSGDVIQDLGFSFQKSANCSGADAGTQGPDAGTGQVDAGTDPTVADAGSNDPGTVAPGGCGCTSVEPLAAAFGLLALAGLARRRRHG